MSKTDELLSRIKELEKKNRLLQSENEALQNAINKLSPFDYSSQYAIRDDIFVPQNNFWTEPLKDFWGQTKRTSVNKRFGQVRGYDFGYGYGLPTDYPWMAADDSPEDREKEDMRKKVKELEDLIETMRKELESVSEPLALVVDAIKKEAMFNSVGEAFKLLQKMNAIFADYEPWKKNVQPLENFLMKEKNRASMSRNMVSLYPSDRLMAEAISSINGKGKVLDERQKWMGVCSLVMARCGYPHNLKDCCERLAALPYEKELEIPCNYDNVRKLQIYGFARENYERWPSYKPGKEEKKYFDCCRDVARALEHKLELE